MSDDAPYSDPNDPTIAYWKKRLEQSEKEKEELRHKNETLEHIHETLIRENQRMRSLVVPPLREVAAFPPLRKLSQSPQKVNTSAKLHEEVVPDEGTLGIIKDLRWNEFPVDTRLTASFLTYGTETDLQGFVEAVLRGALGSLCGEDKVFVSREHIVGGFKADIFVVYVLDDKSTWPIGIVEVKQPSGAVSNQLAIGQLCDYMVLMESMYGVKLAFGILTDYNEWRFFWLPAANEVAKASKITERSDLNPADALRRPQQLDVLPELKAGTEVPVASLPSLPTVSRKIYGTRIFNLHEEKDRFLDALGSVLIKMFNAPRKQPSFAQPAMPQFVALPTAHFLIMSKLPEDFKLQIGALPRFQASDVGELKSQSLCLYLLYLLGKGRDGKVWLAATPEGRGCVLKLLHKDWLNVAQLLPSAQKEAEIWRVVWELPAYWCSLAGRAAVVMPYLRPVKRNEWTDPSIVKVIADAVDVMVEKGYLHNDLHRWHVGLYSLAGDMRAALFDLSDVDSILPSEKDSAKKRMLRALDLSVESAA